MDKMRKTDMLLFGTEEEVIKNAEQVLNEESNKNNTLYHDFENLLNNYKKIQSQFGKLIHISDKQQRSLNKLNDELTEKNTLLNKANHRYEELNKNLEMQVEKEINNRQQKERLLMQTSKMATMGEMIESIAHQWRQPLTTIGILVSNLQDACRHGEADEELINNKSDTIMSQIFYMSETIDDFRNFFKIDKVMASFDVRHVVKDVIKLLSHLLKRSNVSICLNLEEDKDYKSGLTVKGYVNELKQALLNIINNSRDAIVERNKKEKFRGEIVVDLLEAKGKVVIEVKDNGGGIAPEIVDKLFTPYFTTKGDEKGTGIGLHICRTIVENNMGGKLSAENSEKGAIFRIELNKEL